MSKVEAYNSSIIDEIFDSITTDEEEKVRKRMLLATRIDKGIKAKGWKKKDLAAALNKRRSEITKWLSGTHNFNLDTLFDIERVLNIKLITLEDAPKPQVIKFNVIVSQTVETPASSQFGGFTYGNSLVSFSNGSHLTFYTAGNNNLN